MAPPRGKKRASNVQTGEVTDEDRQPGVVYIGHVPHGFYEKQLLQYFSQFGKVLSIKLSRSKKSGNSKGYAFVKFKYAAVAKTVAETCHNYLFFNKLLKCEYKPLSEVHEDTFFSFKWKPNTKRKRQHNNAKPTAKLEESIQRSVGKQRKKLSKLKDLGINLSLDDVMNVPEVKGRQKSADNGKPLSVSHEMELSKSEASTTPQIQHKKSKRATKSIQETTESEPGSQTSSPKKRIKTMPSTDMMTQEESSIESRGMKRKRPKGQGVSTVKILPGSKRKTAVAKKTGK